MYVEENSSMNSAILIFSVIGLAMIALIARSKMMKNEDEGFKKMTVSKCNPFVFKKYKEDDRVATHDDFERI